MALFTPYTGAPLMERICSIENLTLAWRRVRGNIHVARRGRSAGSDAISILDFEADWSRQMSQLAEELQQGAYRPLPARMVQIPKQHGGSRAIAILSVRDRVAQRAVQQVLEPLFDPYFLDCSYGCRPRIGVPEALARVQRYADGGLMWAVDADITAYFDAIDHRVLLGIVRQRISEVAVLQLIGQWLTVGMLDASEAGAQCAETPLQRGASVFRRAAAWGSQTISSAFEQPAPSYQIDAWTAQAGVMPYVPQRSAPQTLWDLALMAQPVVNGARVALPYLRNVGGRRLAVAGAVAAGAIAAAEFAMRLQPATFGAPQGGALSPLLANIYLHPFDVALSSQGMRLVRFMDDFVVMCASREEAEQALALVEQQLRVLRLTLHAEKTRIVAYEDGLEFLGETLAARARPQPFAAGAHSFAEAEQLLRDMAQRVRKIKGGNS